MKKKKKSRPCDIPMLCQAALIAEQFADLQGREAQAERLEAGEGQQMIIDVSRSTRTAERPEKEQAIIHDVEGFGFVAVMVFAV